ncbi:MAG: hypothetical protein ACFFBH_15240 [Promethearchaeota archaeon]
MKHKKALICIFIFSILVAAIILVPVFYNIIVVQARIYYITEYNIDFSNREEIIDKVENLNYTAYLHNNDYIPPYPIYKGISSYVDRNLINFLKSRIETDTGSWWRGLYSLFGGDYHQYLRYSFSGDNQSKLYLTYNNNTIFDLKDQNNQSLLLKVEGSGELDFRWFLNFTYIPYVYDNMSTLDLSELIFIKINLEYEWVGSYALFHQYLINQYLLLNKNLDVILIFIYYNIFID